MNDFRKTADRYEKELLEREIPFWTEHGIDRRNGGFFSCLNRDGSVYDTMKQAWMQWRAVYLFAVLANSRYSRPEFLEYAVRGYDFLVKHMRRADGSYRFIVSAEGAPVSDGGDGAEVFSESFAAIACAELYRASGGEERYRTEAESALRVYRENIRKSENSGFVRRIQYGHYMILANVLQVMEESFGTPGTRECARGLFRFLNPEYGVIFERINADGSFDLASQDGRFTNPGHALEGMWFILKAASKHAWREETDLALPVIRRTLEYGWDSAGGGIRYFRDVLDLPVAKNEYMLKAWWPQNEAMTACLYAYRASHDAFFLDMFRKIDDFSWRSLRDVLYPEWFAYAPVDGRLAHSYKGSRWKGFFHIPRYLLECSELLRGMES